MALSPPAPPGTYWVAPPDLLAGRYPVGRTGGDDRLEWLGALGVTLVVDLTEKHEGLPPYAHLLDGAKHARRPIPDLGTVAREDYVETLDLVDGELARGGRVYVHCLGGIGRTGTVVGCWLVRHGLADGDAVGRIARLRAGLPDAFVASPQTDAQEAVVRGWAAGD